MPAAGRSATEPDPASFAALLRQHRQAAGLTQAALAALAGLSERTISDLERGLKATPHPHTVARLSGALGLADVGRATFVASASRAAPRAPTNAPATPRLPPASPPPLPTGGYLGAAPLAVLVGRERERERIARALVATRGGTGQVLLLAGEPGVGKTRLAQEAMGLAREQGIRVLIGRCYEQDAARPFAPLLEPLAAGLALASAELRAAVPLRFPALGLLLPEFAASVPLPDAVAPRQRLFNAVGRFLQALATEGPLALLLDDLHWADPSSLALLGELARALAGRPVLLLCAYRDLDLDRQPSMERLLLDLRRERRAETLPLRGLPLAGTAALIGGRFGLPAVPEELVHFIQQRTEGNPFFVEEVLSALVEQGAISAAGDGWERAVPAEMALPWTVRAMVGQRVGRLSAGAQDLLRAASVLGQEWELGVLLGMVSQEEMAALSHLDAALAMRLLEERGHGPVDRFAFGHTIVQQTLYEELSPHRLRRLHLRAGETIEALRPEQAAADLARHFLAGGDLPRAAAYTLAAGDHAADLYAYDEAAGRYASAVELLEESAAGHGEVAAARRKLGAALVNVARTAEAIAAYQAAAAAYQAAGEVALLAEVRREIGGAYRAAHDYRRAIEHLLAAYAGWPGGHNPRAYTQLLLELAGTQAGHGTPAEAVALARRGLALAEEHDDPALQAQALMTVADCLALGGALDSQIDPLLDRAEPLAEGARALYTLYRVYNNRGSNALHAGRLQAAAADFRRAVEVTRRAGLPGREAWAGANLAVTLWLQGEWAEGRQALRRASGLDPDAASDYLGLWLAGDHQRALAAALERAAAFQQRDDVQRTINTNSYALAWYLDLGRAGDALALAREAADLLRAHAYWDKVAEIFGPLAEAAVRASAADAGALLAEAEALVARHEKFQATPQLLLARGLLLRNQGDGAGAIVALHQSAEVAREQAALPGLARALSALAEWTRDGPDAAIASAADAERAAIVSRIGPETRGLVWARGLP